MIRWLNKTTINYSNVSKVKITLNLSFANLKLPVSFALKFLSTFRNRFPCSSTVASVFVDV